LGFCRTHHLGLPFLYRIEDRLGKPFISGWSTAEEEHVGRMAPILGDGVLFPKI
jgi:hypothetical protein